MTRVLLTTVDQDFGLYDYFGRMLPRVSLAVSHAAPHFVWSQVSARISLT